jgi:hypothetical protein
VRDGKTGGKKARADESSGEETRENGVPKSTLLFNIMLYRE